MSCFAKVKCFLACIIVYYISYLYNYKCPSLTPLEQAVEGVTETVLHPLHSHHSVLCEYLHSGIDTVQPYHAKVHDFLDEHIHQHPLFIEYKIEDKLTSAKKQFSTYVYPYINELYTFTDALEVQAYAVVEDLQQRLKQD
ncbi:hypothetical protein SBY92_003863 [Candida maltosa Xu316]|uniref:Uncharacterized protein n=1 Tax=Candida maltosa (strain Xu316) TaxID=1245528 RepID=M3IPZ9_CANMX|nr:hypothetical protein G210_0892 [Candida maltosa Xu316]